MLQPVNSGFNSPSSTSLIQSKSHSRIISNLDDDTKTLNKDLLDCKETILLKNPSISNWSEKQMIKSRNARQTSFCSKTLKESDKFNSSRGIGEEKSIKQFDRKIFLTEESQKRKMINLNDNEPQLWSVIELENWKSNMLTFCDNYEKLSNWILELRDVRHDLHVENCIFELCTQNKEINTVRRNIKEIDYILEKNREDTKTIQKLLETLSSMILSKQRNIGIDSDSCQLIQNLFGDKILVKILKHINSKTSQSKSAKRNASKWRHKNFKNSLAEIKKIISKLESNVLSQDQFLIDESINEQTQYLFTRALTVIDKLISNSLNDQSTNKTNSDWETKSVSWDKTIFDIDSKIMIQPDFTKNKKIDLDKVNTDYLYLNWFLDTNHHAILVTI